jgi:hypothetical protein
VWLFEDSVEFGLMNKKETVIFDENKILARATFCLCFWAAIPL